MPENIADLIRRLRRVDEVERDTFVATRLRGPTTSPAELQWRALFVTALREAETWPPSERYKVV